MIVFLLLTLLSNECYNPHMHARKKIGENRDNSNNDDRNHRVVGLSVR